ncbi:Hypothetical protein ORPV_340, partial [Orpheovirus IHUMI-LCC2]
LILKCINYLYQGNKMDPRIQRFVDEMERLNSLIYPGRNAKYRIEEGSKFYNIRQRYDGMPPAAEKHNIARIDKNNLDVYSSTGTKPRGNLNNQYGGFDLIDGYGVIVNDQNYKTRLHQLSQYNQPQYNQPQYNPMINYNQPQFQSQYNRMVYNQPQPQYNPMVNNTSISDPRIQKFLREAITLRKKIFDDSILSIIEGNKFYNIKEYFADGHSMPVNYIRIEKDTLDVYSASGTKPRGNLNNQYGGFDLIDGYGVIVNNQKYKDRLKQLNIQ